MQLYNPLTKESKEVNQLNTGNVHPDVLKQIDQRNEPLESANAVDNERMLKVVDDPTTDPDGAARRADTADAFPAWVLEEYRVSPHTYWGRPHADGKEHLIPKESLVKAVIQTHVDSNEYLGKMLELCVQGSNMGSHKALLDSYTFMFGSADKSYHFIMMGSLGSMVRTAFAERAFTKYAFLSALRRQKPDVELPEFMGFLKERMIVASAMCGTLYTVHRTCWDLCEYKGIPEYRVENEIKVRLANEAKRLEDRNKPVEAPRPSLNDQRSLAAMC